MNKTIIKTDKAPAAIGPYSQAVKTGQYVFTSGTLPIDIETGHVEKEDIKKATANIFNNLKSILMESGLTLDNIVKTTVFMTDLAEFKDMNEVYGTFFLNDPPARSTVQVAALPLGAKIEIEAVAVIE